MLCDLNSSVVFGNGSLHKLEGRILANSDSPWARSNTGQCPSTQVVSSLYWVAKIN